MLRAFIFILFYIFIHNNSFSNVNREDIINYLEGFSSLESDFIQINNNGDILSGKILVLRPGKFRIEYNQIPLLIISNRKKVAVINKQLKSIIFHALDDIPVGVLLFNKLSMRDIKILKLIEKENRVSIDVVDSNFKDQGFVEILFETNPFNMRKWTIFKNDDSKTEVFFNNLVLNKKLLPKLFDIEKEDPRKIPWKN
jgi:outer membrane lipoprotein-sorting protein